MDFILTCCDGDSRSILQMFSIPPYWRMKLRFLKKKSDSVDFRKWNIGGISLYNWNIFCAKLDPRAPGKRILSPHFMAGALPSNMTYAGTEIKWSSSWSGEKGKILLPERQVECTRPHYKTTKCDWKKQQQQQGVTCTHFKSIASIPSVHVVRSKTFSLIVCVTSSQRVFRPPHSRTAWQLL